MTGSEFQAWLATEEPDTRQRMEEADKYVKWGSHIQNRELAEAKKCKATAHQARVSKIIEYCEVHFQYFLETEKEKLNPPITIGTLNQLETFRLELNGNKRSPLTFRAFSSHLYFKSGIPRYSRHWDTTEHYIVAKSSLKSILELEVKQLQKRKRMDKAERMSTEILDKNLPQWLVTLNIEVLPPTSDATIILFNSVIEAWRRCEQETGIKLTSEEFPLFDSLLRKLALCLPGYGDRIYKSDYYDRSSFVYCGFCDDRTAGRCPMSLTQANGHMTSNHEKEVWKLGMLRKLPPGQPVFDGRCTCCKVLLLVAADHGEIKSGVECKTCKKKWCFQCMDKRIWHGVDDEGKGVITRGEIL